MINIDDEKYDKYNIPGVIKHDGRKYYVKFPSPDFLGIELVMERLAKLVGINCAHYELTLIDDVFFCLSEDIAGDKEFILGTEFFDRIDDDHDERSLYGIWDALEYTFHDPQTVTKLMNSILKVYFFDILFINDDRHNSNWGLLIGDDTKEVYILDNELSFVPFFNVFLSAKYIPGSFDTDDDFTEEEVLRNHLAELEYFLNISSSEYRDMCLDMYNVFTPSVVEKTFNEVEQTEDIIILWKNYYLKLYKNHYERVGKLLIGRGLK